MIINKKILFYVLTSLVFVMSQLTYANEDKKEALKEIDCAIDKSERSLMRKSAGNTSFKSCKSI